jgi:hypothetical protein
LIINDKEIKKSHFQQLFESEEGIIIATSDYMKALPNGIAKWSKLDFTALGTDGFGLSETRESLRDFFEIDYKWIAYTALQRLATLGKLDWQIVRDFVQNVDIQLDKITPMLPFFFEANVVQQKWIQTPREMFMVDSEYAGGEQIALIHKTHKKVGDLVQTGELLMEIHGDLMDYEVISEWDGMIQSIFVKDGDSVSSYKEKTLMIILIKSI